MAYVVKAPDGRVVQETQDFLEALDTMHACGKGSTTCTAEGVLLATNAGKFAMRVGRDEVHPAFAAVPSFATAMPRVSGWS